LQQFLWIVAMDNVICPGVFAFGRSQRDHRQVRRGSLHQLDDVFGVKTGDAAVHDEGIDSRKQMQQVNGLQLGMRGDDVELEGLQQKLAGRQRLLWFGFGNKEGWSRQRFIPTLEQQLPMCESRLRIRRAHLYDAATLLKACSSN